jgi:hypothetical protein
VKKSLGLILAFSLVALALAPIQAPAVQCTTCNQGAHCTGVYCAQGMTCQGAKDKLDELAADDMVATCGTDIPCFPTLVVTTSCFTNAAGKKEVCGYFTHGCATCIV